MATTTNYGWETPDNTDLVRDGAEAIRDLGEAIDNTVYLNSELGSGLTLINSTSFTTQASVSLSNILDSTYTFYRIVINVLSSAGNQTLRFRCRENVTDKTTDYSSALATVNTLGTIGGIGAGGADWLFTSNIGTDDQAIVSVDLFRSATRAAYSGLGWNPQATATVFMGGQNTGLTNFTGFTIFPSNTGTITGTVRVYGYQET